MTAATPSTLRDSVAGLPEGAGPMLEVRGVAKRFSGLEVLSDVSLSVRNGSITALVGPNGAGKTTLFGIASGFIKPDVGDVLFETTCVSKLAAHEVSRAGLVRTFQITQPFMGMSVLENIAVGAYSHLSRRGDALDYAHRCASVVGMTTMLDTPADALTVAARKRLELARALATEPRLLLLDEVMAGLNPSETNEVIECVKSIRAQGVTIFLIEHVMQAVMSLAETLYVLANGTIVAGGLPVEVVRNPKVVEAYLGHGMAERLARQDHD